MPNLSYVEYISHVAELNFVSRDKVFLVEFCTFAFVADYNVRINKIVLITL